jgi:Family of unknown function (DUF5357)
MEIIKDLFGVFNIFEGIYERIKKILIPPRAYSWQTLIYLSIFSAIMSALANHPFKDVISFFGWIFLIAGTSWYTTDQPILIPGTNMPVGALITGFLVSYFAFGGREDADITSRTLVWWPTISAIITAIPEFFEGSGIDYKRQLPKAEIRQRIIVLVGCCMILSAWLQLTYTIDRWVRLYPSIQSDNFSRSSFVVSTQPQLRIPENGDKILTRLEPLVVQQLDRRDWSEVVRWLNQADERVSALGKQVIDKQLAQYEERQLWTVESRVNSTNNKSTSDETEYRLDLLSIWNGPSSNAKRYYLRKSCQIAPVDVPANISTVNIQKPGEKVKVAEVQCEPKRSFFAGSPPPRQ